MPRPEEADESFSSKRHRIFGGGSGAISVAELGSHNRSHRRDRFS